MRFKKAEPEDFEDEQDFRDWKIRSTLSRHKTQVRVIPMRGPATKELIGDELDQANPPALPFDCKDSDGDTCYACHIQFFPAALDVDDSQAQTMIDKLTRSISDSRNDLLQLLGNHAPRLASKWRKMTVTKRTSLLEQVSTLYPGCNGAIHIINMFSEESYELRNAAVRILENLQGSTPKKQEKGLKYNDLTDEVAMGKFRDTWLLPYLDIPTLADDPAKLLGLVFHRSVTHPSAFVSFDNSQLVLSEHYRAAVVPTFSRLCVTLTDGDEYGKLVPWSKHAAHHWTAVGFNKAHHLLNAQAALMSLLTKITKAVVGDTRSLSLTDSVPASSLLGNIAKVIVGEAASSESSTPTSQDIERWKTVLVTRGESIIGRSGYLHQPFNAPMQIPPAALLNMVTERYNLAADELWLLQTEPAHMIRRCREFTAGNFFSGMSEYMKWGWCTDEVVMSAIRRETYWRQYLYEVTRLTDAYAALNRNSTLAARRYFQHMLFTVEDCSLEMVTIHARDLEFVAPFQHGFEGNYGIDPKSQDRTGGRPTVRFKDYFKTDVLFWALTSIGTDDHRPLSLDPVVNLRIIEDCITKPGASARRLNWGVTENIGDLAVADEVRVAMRCFPGRDQSVSDPAAKSASETQVFRDYINKIQKVVVDEMDKGLHGLLRNVCVTNSWPVGIKDEVWLKRATASRRALSAFWAKLRGLYEDYGKKAKLSKKYLADELDRLSVDSKAAHKEDVEAERQMVLKAIEARKVVVVAPTPYIVPTSDEPTSKENIATPSKKKKTKTRKAASHAAKIPTVALAKLDINKAADGPTLNLPPPASVVEDAETASAHDHRIKVKANNLRVFHQMLSEPNDDADSVKSVSWQHFCQAMADAGFIMTQSSGSAVSFKLAKDVEGSGTSAEAALTDYGSICFHRPHPEAVLDPVMLKSMGKRMRKWFGWHGDMFVER